MANEKAYGEMPPAPPYQALVKGDAGLYRVWGIDWMEHAGLLDRAGLEWTPISRVKLMPIDEKTRHGYPHPGRKLDIEGKPMAVIEYIEGDHAAGFVGIRVVTTLGTNSEYRQAYFSYNDYSPGRARYLAEALHEQWRAQALAQRQHDWVNRPNARSGQGWIAAGLRADILRECKIRGGRRRMYYAPAFIADQWPRDGEGGHKYFRVNVPAGRSLEEAFHTAVRHYASVRELFIEDQACLLARQPDPQIFVKLAIRLALKEYAIDINAIRRRVGVPEL